MKKEASDTNATAAHGKKYKLKVIEINNNKKAENRDQVLIFTENSNLTKPGQFGLSFEGVIEPALEEVKKVFMKLPPSPEDLKTDDKPLVDKVAHYQEMNKRFLVEFQKQCLLWRSIQVDIGETGSEPGFSFSIARPLALVQEIDGEERTAILYEYKGADLEMEKERQAGFKISSDADFFSFALSLTRIVRKVHNQGILHSFIVPRNIVRESSAPTNFSLVGFGYSTFCGDQINTPLLDVSAFDQKFRAPECRSMDNLGALWYPADIFSIGAILYYYSTSETLWEIVPKDVEELKRYVYNKFKSKNESLFENNENILKILDKCLRHDPEDRYSCAEELIESLEIAEASGGANMPRTAVATNQKSQQDRNKPNEQAKGNIKNVPEIRSGIHPLFQSLLEYWNRSLNEDQEAMGKGHYEIYGHRDVLVTSLCRLIAGAKPGDTYTTMTLPSYWTDENLGKNGRFLTMNKHMARLGLYIKRLFLVTQDFHQLSEEEQDILEAQWEAQRDVLKYLDKERKANVRDSGKKKGFEIKVIKLDNPNRWVRFERDGIQVAYLQGDDDNPLCLNFISQGRYEWLNGRQTIHRRIKKVRYWQPKLNLQSDNFNKHNEQFDSFWESGSLTLKDYIGAERKVHLDDLLKNRAPDRVCPSGYR